MIDKKKLIRKLEYKTRQLEKQIEHNNMYKAKIFVSKLLIKSGIVLDFALPFIIATTICYYTGNKNIPFKKDLVTKKIGIETIDTSTGVHLERYSDGILYEDIILEHSTGWIINDEGQYQRTITRYRIIDEIDLSNIEEILNMSQDEIENKFEVGELHTITKTSLCSDDYIYNQEALIIISDKMSDETTNRLETSRENEEYSVEFIGEMCVYGIIIRLIEFKICKNKYVRNKLKEYEPKDISKNELEKVLELERENLQYLTSNDCEDIGYSYKLRKS